MFGQFFKTYKHKCPDGTIRIIHRDIDKAFPLALKNLNSKIDADIAAQKAASAKLTAEYSSKIESLLFSIDEQNQSLMLNYRFAYIAFQSNPCNDSGFLQRKSDEMSKDQARILELKTKIRGLIHLAEHSPHQTKQILAVYNEILASIKGANVLPAVVVEIGENRDAAKKWVEGGGANG